MGRALSLFVSSLFLVTALACATNPVTGQREVSFMGEGQEVQLGQQSDQQIRAEMGLYDDAQLQQYVERVGLALARVSHRPNLPWHFAIADASAVNAFALPGGYVYVTRGILPFLDSEAQLAGVLGHEIGHVAARHSAQQYTRATGGSLGLAALGILVPGAAPIGDLAGTGLGVLFLKYSRDDERQADQLGVEYGAKAGWAPRGVSEMLTTLGRLDATATDRKGVPNWLSTHPQPADRVQRIAELVSQAEAGGRQWKVERDAYLQAIDGVIFGDDPRQGIVRGSDFLHPDLRIAMTFPAGWPVDNGASQVVAKAPDADAFLLLQLVQKPTGASLSDIAQAHMSQSGFSRLNGSTTSVNGVSAYIGTYNGNVKDLGEVVVRAAHLSDGSRVYVLAGLAPAPAYRLAEPSFSRTIQSFRRMSAAEAALIRPNRVRLYTARAGDTWQAIAERAGNLVKPATLAIMNDHEPTDPPRAGERLKTIVAG